MVVPLANGMAAPEARTIASAAPTTIVVAWYTRGLAVDTLEVIV